MNGSNTNNFNLLANNIEKSMRQNTITIRPGRILWHARWQDKYGKRRNVMKSPDYLYTSPQISQAILHGFSTKPSVGTVVELTKLRVKKPIHLILFKNPTEQIIYASQMGINNFQPFTTNDIKLFKYVCEDADGYRAVWDQDQIALCAKVIREKLEKVSSKNFTNKYVSNQFGFNTTNINFMKSPSKNKAYYETSIAKRLGRRLVKSVKRTEKNKAIELKKERKKIYQVAPLLKKFVHRKKKGT
jgi:hypothetical protein